MNMTLDKFNEECAVVGLINVPEASNYCYLGLYSLQHRGQEGAGIVTSDGEVMIAHRDMGLVADVFTAETLKNLEGTSAVGHTRYATFGSKDWANLQPFVANFADNSFAVAHNGNLVNANEIRSELEQSGSIFSSTSDTEVVLHLIAKAERSKPLSERVASALSKVKGAYSIAVLSHSSLVAARDPHGVRPLSLGKLGDGYIVASETCAFDLVGATFIRDIEPGEILQIHNDGSLHSDYTLRAPKEEERALCVFEYVYFSRPDSSVQGKNVYMVRKNLGIELAKEYPVDADLVIPVPDSGVPSAIGYAYQAGLPLEIGLIRNHYVGRTFIEPKQAIRDFGVKVKLNANPDILKGKRVVVVDDSIVRGTTCKKLVAMLKAAGAKEIHFRISSPPTINSCYYGIDTPSKEELIAATHSIEETCSYIEADSLAYLSIEGMYRAVGAPRKDHCDACFSSVYKIGVPGDLETTSGSTGKKNANRSNRPGK
jgi:amidophosphoribosyltransferase